MRLLTVSDDEATKSGVMSLAGLDWFSKESRVITSFMQDNCFDGVTASELKHLVVLGHACTDLFGDYSAHEFARRFAQQFEKTNQDKNRVEHIYMIGCGIGLGKAKQNSLAQKIANELQNQGFYNLMVHAIANPDNLPAHTNMIVEVITHPGATSIAGIRPGYVAAYVLTEQQSKEIDDLEEKLAKEEQNKKRHLLANKVRELKAKSLRFLDAVDPVIELSKQKNIFLPGETNEARLLRIERAPETLREQQEKRERMLREARKQEIICLIRTRRDYIVQKNSKDKSSRKRELIANLDLLIKSLETIRPDQCEHAIKINLDLFKSIAGRHAVSTTYDMLVKLSEGKTPELETVNKSRKETSTLLKQGQKLKKEKEKKEKSAKKKDTLNPTPTELGERKRLKDGKSNVKEANSHSGSTLNVLKQLPAMMSDVARGGAPRAIEQIMVRNERMLVPEPEPYTITSDALNLEWEKQSIQALVLTLETERTQLRASLFSFFNSGDIQLKSEKISALGSLLSSTTMEELRDKANRLKQNQTVIKGSRSTRVRDLLELLASDKRAITFEI